MSSVTPNIGLILPDGSENVSRQVINENYTKIDTAFANVGNSTMREVPFNIPTSAWTLSSGVYTAEFTTAYVTASSKEIGTYTSSLRQYAKADIDMAKKSGGGGMVFTTTTIPTGTISGSLYIWDNDDGKVPIVVEGTVIPISNGGTGGNDLSTAKSNLGITAVENQTSANTQAIATLNNQMGNMGSIVEIANITASGDSTITHDLDQYRYIYFAYYSATFYRQTAIYHKAIMTGTVKAGFDNLLDGSNRCYCLKTAYNPSTHVMNLSTVLPSTGTWQGGSFYIYGIK